MESPDGGGVRGGLLLRQGWGCNTSQTRAAGVGGNRTPIDSASWLCYAAVVFEGGWFQAKCCCGRSCMHISRLLFLGCLLAEFPAAVCAQQAVERPDIVVILADDFGLLDGSPWGAPQGSTPQLQQLAEAGLVFDQAFVASPSCAPSRAALLTGLWPARNGAESNHSRPHASLRKWPAYFRELGYETAAFGKVSHYKHTVEYGFDHFAHDTFHDHAGIQAAADFLRSRRAAADSAAMQPLCLMIGSNWPHVPWPELKTGEVVADSSVTLPAGSIDTAQTRHWRQRYLAAVRKLDEDLGLIVRAVREHLPGAIVVFSADHGAQWPLAKWNLYDAGIRTPLIVAWPGKIAPGRTSALVSWIDLLPTLVELAGGPGQPQLDGQSFVPVLRQSQAVHREVIFASHANDNRMNVYPMRCVRTAGWKYIRNLRPDAAFTTHIDLVGGRLGQRAFFAEWEAKAATDTAAAVLLRRYHQRPAEELYDLRADPHEQVNLAEQGEHVAQLQQLRLQLDDWLAATGDRLQTPAEPRLLNNSADWGPGAAEAK